MVSEESIENKFFCRVISLNEESFSMTWEEAFGKIPLLPKGWFELSRLSREDRISFTRDFWLIHLGEFLTPFIKDQLDQFFLSLDDVIVCATQEVLHQFFNVRIIYLLKDHDFFFQGSPPARDDEKQILNDKCRNILPLDYLSFFNIHNGFGKSEDKGIISTKTFSKIYQRFQNLLYQEEMYCRSRYGMSVLTFIPFFESEEINNFQCFYLNRESFEDVGNTFFSESLLDCQMENYEKEYHFPSFISWLGSYLTYV